MNDREEHTEAVADSWSTEREISEVRATHSQCCLSAKVSVGLCVYLVTDDLG